MRTHPDEILDSYINDEECSFFLFNNFLYVVNNIIIDQYCIAVRLYHALYFLTDTRMLRIKEEDLFNIDGVFLPRDKELILYYLKKQGR